MRLGSLAVAALLAGASPSAAHAQVARAQVPGVVNFAQVESTVACAGSVRPDAVAELKQRGYKAIVNLQLPEEQGADVAGETEAAKVAGITYLHLPIPPQAFDPAAIDRFLAAVADPANQPVFIHCAGGSRAAGLWMIKRVLVDGWDVGRATAEAESLGLSNAAVKTRVLDYLRDHGK
jgi:uncharacterized protein (TIGR01244 family)